MGRGLSSARSWWGEVKGECPLREGSIGGRRQEPRPLPTSPANTRVCVCVCVRVCVCVCVCMYVCADDINGNINIIPEKSLHVVS